MAASERVARLYDEDDFHRTSRILFYLVQNYFRIMLYFTE